MTDSGSTVKDRPDAHSKQRDHLRDLIKLAEMLEAIAAALPKTLANSRRTADELKDRT
jgi:hypothetical protein